MCYYLYIGGNNLCKILNKIFSGYYVTDRERKDSIKSTIELLAKEEKLKAKTQDDIQRIDNQANAIKSFIENIKEGKARQQCGNFAIKKTLLKSLFKNGGG